MTADQRATGEIFGPHGTEVELRSYSDLVAKLAAIERRVPRRTQGRTQTDRERYRIIGYLRCLAEAGLLELPVTVRKAPGGEAPDFVLFLPDGRKRGIEVTEASTPEHQRATTQLEKSPPGTLLEGDELRLPGEPLRGRGFVGDEPERKWSAILPAAVQRKVTGYDYGDHDAFAKIVR